MFITFLPALTLQIKQYNLRLWDPFYIKGVRGGANFFALRLCLVPLWGRFAWYVLH